MAEPMDEEDSALADSFEHDQMWMATTGLKAALVQLNSDLVDDVRQAALDIQCELLGNNQRRLYLLKHHVPAQLMNILQKRFTDQSVRRAVVNLIIVFLVGSDTCCNAMLELGLPAFLLSEIENSVVDYKLDCMSCLRILFTHGRVDGQTLTNHIQAVLSMMALTNSNTTSKYNVATILKYACKTQRGQAIMFTLGAVDTVLPLLFSNVPKVQLAALQFFVHQLYDFQEAGLSFRLATLENQSTISRLFSLLSPWNCAEIRLAVSQCLIFLYQMNCLTEEQLPKISNVIIPELVKLLRTPLERRNEHILVEVCDTLTQCIRADPHLQWVVSWNNQSPQVLQSLLNACMEQWYDPCNSGRAYDFLRACLNLIASLLSSREDVCRRVMSNVSSLNKCLTSIVTADNMERKPTLAALNCMVSISRWAEQLRTSFFDAKLGKAVLKLQGWACSNNDTDMLISVTALCCNLLLEYSPCKDKLLSSGILEQLSPLLRHTNKDVRLNAAWALQNCAYRTDITNRSMMIKVCSPADVQSMMAEEPLNSEVVLRLLYTMLNLLSCTVFVDVAMGWHGNDIMRMVSCILDDDYPSVHKEAALMIWAHVADSDSGKALLNNDEVAVLTKLIFYMQHSCTNLQVAAVKCVSNLLSVDRADHEERTKRLKEAGVVKILQQLLSTENSCLYRAAKLALVQVERSDGDN